MMLTSYFGLQSRAALSLLGYCYHQMQDFVNAADCYEQLTFLNPEVEDYKLYYAQSLYKACLFEESMKMSCQIDNPTYQTKVFWQHDEYSITSTYIRVRLLGISSLSTLNFNYSYLSVPVDYKTSSCNQIWRGRFTNCSGTDDIHVYEAIKHDIYFLPILKINFY